VRKTGHNFLGVKKMQGKEEAFMGLKRLSIDELLLGLQGQVDASKKELEKYVGLYQMAQESMGKSNRIIVGYQEETLERITRYFYEVKWVEERIKNGG
jgi:hypothetical protein